MPPVNKIGGIFVQEKTKKCSGPCGLVLPIDQFYWNSKEQRCKVGKCKTCWSAYIKARKKGMTKAQRRRMYAVDREWARRDKEADPEKWSLRWKRSDLKKKFGVSLEWYQQKLIEQGGGCAICGLNNHQQRQLAVDHNHKTGKNRGLLCGRCNAALERLEAHADWHNKAYAYLALYTQVS